MSKSNIYVYMLSLCACNLCVYYYLSVYVHLQWREETEFKSRQAQVYSCILPESSWKQSWSSGDDNSQETGVCVYGVKVHQSNYPLTWKRAYSFHNRYLCIVGTVYLDSTFSFHYTHTLQVIERENQLTLSDWTASQKPLCNLTVDEMHTIESSGSHTLQVNMSFPDHLT